MPAAPPGHCALLLISMGKSKKGTKRKNPGVGMDFKRAKHKVWQEPLNQDPCVHLPPAMHVSMHAFRGLHVRTCRGACPIQV